MYFFDTYALIEIIKENKTYIPFADEIVYTSIMNLAELYYAIIRMHSPEIANQWIVKFNLQLLEIDQDIVKKAMIFRFNNKNKKMSMVDCIGYHLAMKYKISFLTGDKAFKDIPDVTFVK